MISIVAVAGKFRPIVLLQIPAKYGFIDIQIPLVNAGFCTGKAAVNSNCVFQCKHSVAIVRIARPDFIGVISALSYPNLLCGSGGGKRLLQGPECSGPG